MATIREIVRKKHIKTTLSLLASITKIPSSGKTQRGFQAEEKAWKAARYWQKKRIIARARRTNGLSSEDREGKDIILTLRDGREVCIDVKNYCDFRAVQRCRERDVLLFPIWLDEDEAVARGRMLDLIMAAYVSGLELFQIRQIVALTSKMKQQPLQPSLIRRIFSCVRKVS